MLVLNAARDVPKLLAPRPGPASPCAKRQGGILPVVRWMNHMG